MRCKKISKIKSLEFISACCRVHGLTGHSPRPYRQWQCLKKNALFGCVSSSLRSLFWDFHCFFSCLERWHTFHGSWSMNERHSKVRGCCPCEPNNELRAQSSTSQTNGWNTKTEFFGHSVIVQHCWLKMNENKINASLSEQFLTPQFHHTRSPKKMVSQKTSCKAKESYSQKWNETTKMRRLCQGGKERLIAKLASDSNNQSKNWSFR